MKVKQITISRLYNLGNYEHVRFELGVEVGENESASQAFRNVVGILSALKPLKAPSVQAYRADELRAELADLEKNFALKDFTSGEPVLDENGKVKIDEESVAGTKERLAEYEKVVADYNQLVSKREEAIAALDNLGGTAVQTDAKQNWETDEY